MATTTSELSAFYDVETSTLELTGTIDRTTWDLAHAEIDRAYHRTACTLYLDISGATTVPPHTVGRLVHLCNTYYPGTIVHVRRPVHAA